MCWSGDDPGPEQCEGLAGHGLYRYAEGFPGLSLMVQETLKRGPMWAERSERKARLLE
jgi:hypothetical protein